MLSKFLFCDKFDFGSKLDCDCQCALLVKQNLHVIKIQKPKNVLPFPAPAITHNQFQSV